jgi:plasmid stabilization system protein ParE
MRVRWTTTAADDLSHIVEYIRKDNPAAARRVAQTIYHRVPEPDQHILIREIRFDQVLM